MLYLRSRIPLDDHSDPEPASRAGGHEAELAVLLDESVRRVHGQSDAGGAERMADGQRSSPVVHFLRRDGAGLLLEAHHILSAPVRIHSLQVSEQLAGKRIVILEDRNIVQAEPLHFQYFWRRISRTQEELVLGILK